MNLSNLKPRPGSRHRTKRLGNGESSGKGKTCGKGHKGQKARSGGSIRLGFEGGQMPLIRRVPKRGFNNAVFHLNYAVVNLSTLEAKFENGATVDEASLLEAGIIRKPYDGVKILGGGELKKKLSITVNKASESAKAAIEKAGGTLTLQ
jgi:large subunit ribosomal protein L15